MTSKGIHHSQYGTSQVFHSKISQEPVSRSRKDPRGTLPTPATPDYSKKQRPGGTPNRSSMSSVSPIASSRFDPSRPAHKTPPRSSAISTTTSKASKKLKSHMSKTDRQLSSLKQEIGGSPVQPPQETSFEREEKRIRREALLKSFLGLLAKILAEKENNCKSLALEEVVKEGRAALVKEGYAGTFREEALKYRFLMNFQVATERYKYRFKLLRNFSRILNRFLRTHTDLVFGHGFKKIKAVKRPFYRTNMRQHKKAVTSIPLNNISGLNQSSIHYGAPNTDRTRERAGLHGSVEKLDKFGRYGHNMSYNGGISNSLTNTAASKKTVKSRTPLKKAPKMENLASSSIVSRKSMEKEVKVKKSPLGKENLHHEVKDAKSSKILKNSNRLSTGTAEKVFKQSVHKSPESCVAESPSVKQEPSLERGCAEVQSFEHSKGSIGARHQELKEEIKNKLLQQMAIKDEDNEEDQDEEEVPETIKFSKTPEQVKPFETMTFEPDKLRSNLGLVQDNQRKESRPQESIPEVSSQKEDGNLYLSLKNKMIAEIQDGSKETKPTAVNIFFNSVGGESANVSQPNSQMQSNSHKYKEDYQDHIDLEISAEREARNEEKLARLATRKVFRKKG